MKKLMMVLVSLLLVSQVAYGSGNFIDTIRNAQFSTVESARVRGIEGSNDHLITVEIKTAIELDAASMANGLRQRLASFTPPLATTTQVATSDLIDGVYASVASMATPTINPNSTTTINKQIRDGSWVWLPDRVKNLSATLLKNLIQGFFGVTLSDVSNVDRWTQPQLLSLYSTLYSLPKTFSKYLTQLVREKIGFSNVNILGYMYWSQPFKAIICDSAFNYKAFGETLVHEMGHLFSANKQGLESKWQALFYHRDSVGRSLYNTAPPTSYGCTNIKEDMAESVKYYWLNGAGMKAKCPDRYEFVRQYIMDGYEYRK